MVTVTPVSTRRGLAAVAAIVALAATWASAQETPAKPPAKPAADCAALQQDLFADLKDVVRAGCTPSQAQIAKLLENPVANFVSIPLQYDYITVKGPHIDDAKITQRLQVTPTFPFGQGRNWTAIHRLVFPFASLPLNKGFGDCKSWLLPATGRRRSSRSVAHPARVAGRDPAGCSRRGHHAVDSGQVAGRIAVGVPGRLLESDRSRACPRGLPGRPSSVR